MEQSASFHRKDAPAYASLVVIAFLCLLPFAWVLVASVDPQATQFLSWPSAMTLQNYRNLFGRENGLRWFINSGITVGLATVIVVVLAGLGGFALSRTGAWWKKPFLYGIILVRVIPETALIVPLYDVMLALNGALRSGLRLVAPADLIRPLMHIFGFLDGYLGLTLVLAASQLPLALWIMKTFFDTIPRDYEEAAAIDGATLSQTIFKVLIPLALPGLAAAGLFTFLSAWGDFLLPLIFLSSDEMQTLPLGIFRAFMRIDKIDYGFLTALCVVYTIPAITAFALARRALVTTFGGGVKG